MAVSYYDDRKVVRRMFSREVRKQLNLAGKSLDQAVCETLREIWAWISFFEDRDPEWIAGIKEEFQKLAENLTNVRKESVDTVDIRYYNDNLGEVVVRKVSDHEGSETFQVAIRGYYPGHLQWQVIGEYQTSDDAFEHFEDVIHIP